MKRIALLLALTLTPQFATLAMSPASFKASESKLIAARKQTAVALRAIATPDDAVVLAKLGDFENARKLASRVRFQKVYVTQSVARISAEDAIRTNEYSRAEREIKNANGSTSLWLKLSKRYKERRRKADARRTAFYALAQVQREKDTHGWGDVAVWLCELGEQAAARRLFAIAKKSLLDPDPLLGSPIDYVYEVAAKCRFDDLIPKETGLFVSMSLVDIYTKQNRDEMARRTIERDATSMEKRYGPQIPRINGSQPIKTEDGTNTWRAVLYLSMAFTQFQRGDFKATQASLKEADSLLNKDNQHPELLQTKFMLFMYCQYTAQWELADKVEADIEKHLQENSSKARSSESKKAYREYFERLRLAGLYVLEHQDKFSLQERQIAFARFKPRAIQHVVDFPSEKARIYAALARAERSIHDDNWRASLQIAQDLATKDLKRKENWFLIQRITTEWQEGGEIEKARQLGLQMLESWKKSESSDSKSQKSAMGIDRFAVVDILVASGLADEAINLLIAKIDPKNWQWEYAFSPLVKQFPSSPPQQIMQLPVASRRLVLRCWADGLTALKRSDTEGLDDHHSFLRTMF